MPFSNRIAGGRLAVAAESHRLAINERRAHALHGHGAWRPWQVTAHTDRRVDLTYTHDAGAAGWIWPYRAEMSLSLTARALTWRLAVTNLHPSRAMPAGLGLHPYFADRDDGLLAGVVETICRPAPIAPAAGAGAGRFALAGNGPCRAAWMSVWRLGRCACWTRRRWLARDDDRRRCFRPFGGSTRRPTGDFSSNRLAAVDGFNLAARGVAGTGRRDLAPVVTLPGRSHSPLNWTLAKLW